MSRLMRFCCHTAALEGYPDHAQKIMKQLGVTYQHATPQSISDSWDFWNCENLPETLPPYLTEVECNPFDKVGYGLSQQDAEKIRDYKL